MSCFSTRSLPGRIEPSRIYFGAGECRSITCTADVADSLDGTYFNIDVPASPITSTKLAVPYYIWFNTSGGSAVDPAPAGRTEIEVAITTGATAIAVATAVETALNALNPKRFRVYREGAVLTVENREMGVVDPAVDVDTGFTIELNSAGFGGDLGATTQDGIEILYESEKVDITSLQTGNLILDSYYLGGAISLSLGLQEMDIDTWELALRSSGSAFVPSSGSKVAGIGESTLFRSFLSTGGQLIIKPLSASNNDRCHTFWKAAPNPESINMNNEIQALQVSFQALLDASIDSRVNAYMFGNPDQDALFLAL